MRRHRQGWWFAALIFCVAVMGRPAQASSPFNVSARMEGDVVRISFTIPAAHFLYADLLKVKADDGISLLPIDVPAPVEHFDKTVGEKKRVYDKSFEAVYRVPAPVHPIKLIVNFQGCNDSVCFFPESLSFNLSAQPASETQGGKGPSVSGKAGEANEWRVFAEKFEVKGRQTGYMNVKDFLAFLDGAAPRSGMFQVGQPGAVTVGMGATILLIILGGLGLNLTPCVLPLIPVNLAIIGAGARAGSKSRGFVLGGIYGLGMAISYGILGLIVVLTGAKFGTLNSSPWFNLGIAIIFVVMALAMFDVIIIDLSRFQGQVPSGEKRKTGSPALAFIMGCVAALLAGACVAPVVITVLLLAGNLYAKGVFMGLLLPFLLGLGMALPWPFAGAGLSFLPRPGKWMTWVKYVFGIIIILFSIYYGHEAWRLFRAGNNTPARDLAQKLDEALKTGKPVFIDFWATWCKNCRAMDETTFSDSQVQKRLDQFVVIHYQAELPNESPAREILDYFGGIGLPTYVILNPKP